MAKNLRYGKTPVWGTIKGGDGVIIDSFNISHEVKDYEQTNERGGVCGYLIYDRTASFDISGTILKLGSASCNIEMQTPNHNLYIGYDCSNTTINNTITKAISGLARIDTEQGDVFKDHNQVVFKNYSVSTTAGGAATFNASGTIYSFDWQINE